MSTETWAISSTTRTSLSTFPKAQHLSISLSGSVNADVLDVEGVRGRSPATFPAWYSRQKQRGIQRPCVYANVSTMSILAMLSQAKISRSAVRLWTAHYDAGEHICGPDSCGYLSIEADGRQWTFSALGRVLDQSELQANFFTTAIRRRTAAMELQSGELTPARMR